MESRKRQRFDVVGDQQHCMSAMIRTQREPHSGHSKQTRGRIFDGRPPAGSSRRFRKTLGNNHAATAAAVRRIQHLAHAAVFVLMIFLATTHNNFCCVDSFPMAAKLSSGTRNAGVSSLSLRMAASSSYASPRRKPRPNIPSRNNNSNNNGNNKNKASQRFGNNPVAESRWQRAVRIETRAQLALESLQQLVVSTNTIEASAAAQLSPSGKNTVIIRRRDSGVLASVPSIKEQPPNNNNKNKNNNSPVTFPDIRECNSALATFGDGGDLLRALRLYFKMRKATQIALTATTDPKTIANDAAKIASIKSILVPTPTLVTYSTLMSRAVSLGKPQVALRLWKIMRDQADFFSYSTYAPNLMTPIRASDLQNLIVPDVKAANILMNTYAKLGDIEAAEDLMMQMQTRPFLHKTTATATDITGKAPPSTSATHDVVFGGGKDVPYLKPNLVTYNTLLDACQKTGELEKALHWKDVLERESKPDSSSRTDITYRNGRALSIRLRPDARTYTSLIGTVARKSRPSNYYGTHDSSLAFQLLDEMKSKHRIAPNPLTYSALIDVCGRCRRSDLALKALRLMLRDEQMQRRMKTLAERSDEIVTLDQQTVGAWTAAINACGKTGRIDTALKLFFVSMPRFRVKPNVVTCSCLLDSLLKQGKTAESLDVLRYMKSNNLRPSEYMYTSLMTYASRLAGAEQGKRRNHDSRNPPEREAEASTQNNGGGENRPWPSLLDSQGANNNSKNEKEKTDDVSMSDPSGEEDDTKAVNLYSELMSTLIGTTTKTSQKRPQQQQGEGRTKTSTAGAINNELYQVTMVFREMKASGVVPDLGSYNTLLRSCANSGDIDRAKEILKEIQDPSNDLEATDRTWRAILRTAGKAKRSDLVLQTWKSAVAELDGTSDRDKTTDSSAPGTTSNNPTPSKKPKKKKSNSVTVETFRVFLTALLICAWDLRKSDHHTSVELYRIIIKCYNALRSSVSKGSNENSSMPANASAEEPPSSSEAAVSPTSYMGLHMVDSNAAVQNPQIMASILQAVVNLESLLDKDDEWKTKLKQLGVAIAKTSCLGDSMQSSTEKRPSKPLSFFDKKALNTARSWY